MTAFLITLCYLKQNEDWRKTAVSFDIIYSKAYKKVKEIIISYHETLSERFIKWIGVSQRIQQYNQRYLDWPALLGSVDATVQSISRQHYNQDIYYSEKHKAHLIKVQAFFSPVGLLINFSKAVPGAMHDFKLLQDGSNLIDEVLNENKLVQQLLGCDATVLGDAGYQGLANLLPGGITPRKKPHGGELSEDDIQYNKSIAQRRIIVNNSFARLKTLWAKMSQKFETKKEPNFLNNYENYWTFCPALTNYHISKHPLRKFENGVVDDSNNTDETDSD